MVKILDYKTVPAFAEAEFVEKKSRFIGYIAPVSTKEEADAFIASIKSKHWDATHNVYAYVLRKDQCRRYSDDGEPQGTAGIPVLDVLLKENLTDCVCVATRYFGGTLLGTGGLVRAYSHTAKIAVDAAGVITMKECYRLQLSVDYTLYGKLNSLISEYGAKTDDTVFADNVTLTFTLPSANYPSFQKELTEISLGKASASVIDELYASF